MEYRSLSTEEIEVLIKNKCIAQNGWSSIHVAKNFSPQTIHSTTFSGTNYLGCFANKVKVRNIDLQSGIRNVHINNCTIHDDCYIKNINTIISDYIIMSGTTICNVDTIFMSENSTFGNGTIVSTVNEGGGREIPIYDDLSVHTAYMLTFHRYKEHFINQITKWINDYSISKRSTVGIIQSGVQIYNCGTIENVKIETGTIIEGTCTLKNGTIKSSEKAPTHIGNNVIAKNFIILHGSKVLNGTNIENCFIGQGCDISNYYSAENSLFFSNCQCLQGEACSIFAGPYTVTHHKSTLLIAGYYSFFNAGSGTNQSNHMYKLGPLHQGITGRGCKTGSNSYLLWPAHIGPFTMILGHHYSNPDISDLPFSYLTETGGKSMLMPAQNTFSVGTARDTLKWTTRDKRKHQVHTDFIITEFLNPYTVTLILKGINTLEELQEKSSKLNKPTILYKNTQLSTSAIPRGIRIYDQAILKYTGDIVIHYLKENTLDKLTQEIKNAKNINEWYDISGLICSTNDMLTLENLATNNTNNLNKLNQTYESFFNNYEQKKSEHALWLMKEYFKVDLSKNFKESILDFIQKWIDNNNKILSSINFDAKKEFDNKCKIGYGIDSNDESKNIEFKIVRGDLELNEFISNLKINTDNLNQIGDIILQKLK